LESEPTITENWVKYEKVTFTPISSGASTTVACDCVSNDFLVPCIFETTIPTNNDDAGQVLKNSGTEITNENRVQGVRGKRFYTVCL
jgi:hypothetical protein